MVLLPSKISISTTFPKNCGRDESLRITTCLQTVARDKQGHAPCKIPLLHKASFLHQSNVMRSQDSYKDEAKSGQNMFRGYYSI